MRPRSLSTLAGTTARPLATARARTPDRKARCMVEYFRVALSLGHDRARLRLWGELDAAAADELAARLEEACAAEPSLLLVDLTDLSFCDSSGIHVLVQGAARCARNDIEMRIVGVRSNVRRVFELTDTAELLHLSNVRDDQR